MRFLIPDNGTRKFQCVNCDDVDPMQLDIQDWIKSELRPPE